jgi:hypothetical protein
MAALPAGEYLHLYSEMSQFEEGRSGADTDDPGHDTSNVTNVCLLVRDVRRTRSPVKDIVHG